MYRAFCSPSRPFLLRSWVWRVWWHSTVFPPADLASLFPCPRPALRSQFSSPPGIGKTTIARALAQRLNAVLCARCKGIPRSAVSQP
ncbi:AAA family ATPase [Rhizobium mongolense]|uniref:AAA family ATPase n=1 Tax=Rhizobium mongolense TaxID=57676 RepID=UPI0011136300